MLFTLRKNREGKKIWPSLNICVPKMATTPLSSFNKIQKFVTLFVTEKIYLAKAKHINNLSANTYFTPINQRFSDVFGDIEAEHWPDVG